MTTPLAREGHLPAAKNTGQRIYLGIDPGVNGGLCSLVSQTLDGVSCEPEIILTRMPATERDLWYWIEQWQAHYQEGALIEAVIEQQMPRTSVFFDKVTKKFRPAGILKTTCLLWGHYQQLRGMLTAAYISFTECPAKRWQKALEITGRVTGRKDGTDRESDSKWKNRLKQRAQQLYPRQKMTLATCDALLLATYCQRKANSRLKGEMGR